jgi:ribose-phosphate pyrophosphokinase
MAGVMAADPPLVFALGASRAFGAAVAGHLGLALAEHEEREFEDGEHKARSLVNVRGRDVYAIHSLYAGDGQSVNDKLVRLLFFMGSLRDASAGRVTALVPYLAYARKDQKSKSRDPVATRYVASFFEAVGTGCLVTMDVHNLAAFQNAFRIPTENLEAAGLLARTAEKYRSEGLLRGDELAGDVEGKVAIIVDDLVSAGRTIDRAAAACKRRGATRVFAAATHGVFAGEAQSVLEASPLERIVVTDTIADGRIAGTALASRVERVSAAPVFAEAISRLHGGGSIAELLGR